MTDVTVGKYKHFLLSMYHFTLTYGDVGSRIIFREHPVTFFCTLCVLQRMYMLSVLNHHGVVCYIMHLWVKNSKSVTYCTQSTEITTTKYTDGL